MPSVEERAENYGVEVDGLQVVGQQSALHSHHVPPKETNILPVYLPSTVPIYQYFFQHFFLPILVSTIRIPIQGV